MKQYDHKKIEKKWQAYWAKKGIYTSKENAKKSKQYVLDMFPYPSGDGLHVGHPKGYIATDVYSRQARMQGKEVLHPMGWDAFGLPAENYAIKNKIHPRKAVEKNIKRFKEQLKMIGLDYDWKREINTTDPDFYKWTQWIFLKLYEKGLAYESYEPINWCPTCQTGLSNEDLEGNACERCGTIVEKRPMRQWILKITEYADRLLEDLKLLPEWQEHIKESQRNWIGKSEGAEIDFELFFENLKLNENRGPNGEKAHITVFTTRPDTLYGATFLILSPEHPWVQLAIRDDHKDVLKNQGAVREYVVKASEKTEIERQENKEKTGVRLEGVEAINPATGEKIPVYVADYVLAGYGTGAIMAVPAHDERDGEFATKFNLPIKQVVAPVSRVSDGADSAREGLAFSDRDAVMCIVKHWEKDEYLCEEWRDYPVRSFVSGGIEKGEDPIGAGKREILEESGYKNAKYIRPIRGYHFMEFYHQAKKVNLRARFQYLYFELQDGEQEKVSEEESNFHTLSWKKPDEILEFVTIKEKKNIWDAFTGKTKEAPYSGNGRLVNSGPMDGFSSDEAKEKITEQFGRKKATYKIRDWVFSRQRYWGEPIPIIHCPKCGVVPVPEKDLPVKLPDVKNYKPTGTGESPLADIKKWVEVECPACKENAKKPKNLIFDFDGVLADTFKQSLQARVDMGSSPDLKVALKDLEAYFSKKPFHSRGDHFTAEAQKHYEDWSHRYAVAKAKLKFKMFDGFIKEIKKIPNARIAVVSAGFDYYSKGPLKKSGIRYTHFLAGNHHNSKESKIEEICKAWKVDIKDVYYFTDTQADVYELEGLLDRKKLIGCSWGYQGFDKLLEVLPENQILKRYSDIQRLWKPQIAKRETNTMPQWAGSSWYYLRYMDPKNNKAMADKKKEKYWAPVDLYVGGAEHATRHLIYARFWHKFLFDQGYVSTPEPFTRLISVGLIQAEDGRKMSKRFGNVINPDDIVKTYGADTLRVYEMFMGPFTDAIAWNTNSMIGARRFLERVWRLQERIGKSAPESVEKLLHRTIKKVGEDIQVFKFNTAISAMMIFVNAAEKGITKAQYKTFLQLLAPFAPHMSEDIWQSLGNPGRTGKKSVHISPWPTFDAQYLEEEIATFVVQVNGKVRGQLQLPTDASEQEVQASAEPIVKDWLKNRLLKVVFVPKRLINFVVAQD